VKGLVVLGSVLGCGAAKTRYSSTVGPVLQVGGAGKRPWLGGVCKYCSYGAPPASCKAKHRG
jgi:hypothetical protein